VFDGFLFRNKDFRSETRVCVQKQGFLFRNKDFGLELRFSYFENSGILLAERGERYRV